MGGSRQRQPRDWRECSDHAMSMPVEQPAETDAKVGGVTTHERPLLRVALATNASAMAAPYGYTITLWSSGALLVRAHGLPSVAEVFGVVAGALVAYSFLALLARGNGHRWETLDNPGNRLLAGALNWVGVAAAVGVVALVATLHSWAAWPLSSLAATFIYIVAASVQLALVTARSEGSDRTEA
jgi:hypothetical protein